MLTRQKTLIHLLKSAGRPVSRTELTKWCFLLRQEFESHGGSAFYDFVPYQFGPFSFLLYQEADKLVAQGYLLESNNTWTVDDGLVERAPTPGAAIERDSAQLLSRFQRYTQDRLVDYVYQRYPAYTVNSKIRRLAERFVADPAVYTSGYEGVTVDAFLNRLVASGIQRLIDVRNNPIARRYGFHKSTLTRLTTGLVSTMCTFLSLAFIRASDRDSRTESRTMRSSTTTSRLLWSGKTRRFNAFHRSLQNCQASWCAWKPTQHAAIGHALPNASQPCEPPDCSPSGLAMIPGTDRTRVLITVMTYPHPSSSYQELVCTAGVTEAGEWVRLYPVDYRYRPRHIFVDEQTRLQELRIPSRVKLLGDQVLIDRYRATAAKTAD